MDRNFKLSLLSVLMDMDLIEFDQQRFEGFRNESDRIEKMLAYFDRMPLPPELLSRIEELCPDGGDMVYQKLFSRGDGNLEFHDYVDDLVIESIEGIGKCKNLRKLVLAEMVADDVSIAPVAKLANLEEIDISVSFRDLEALLSCPKLTFVGMGGGLDSAEKKIVATLRSRGVEVNIDE